MNWNLNCGSSCMPAGLRENDLPHGDDADEPREECLGCGMEECICDEDECDCESCCFLEDGTSLSN